MSRFRGKRVFNKFVRVWQSWCALIEGREALFYRDTIVLIFVWCLSQFSIFVFISVRAIKGSRINGSRSKQLLPKPFFPCHRFLLLHVFYLTRRDGTRLARQHRRGPEISEVSIDLAVQFAIVRDAADHAAVQTASITAGIIAAAVNCRVSRRSFSRGGANLVRLRA